MKEQTKNAIKWLDSLAKTRVKQGVGGLGNSEEGYCCLGWGCKLLKIPYNPNKAGSAAFAKAVGIHDETKFYYLNDEECFSFREIAEEVIKRPHCYLGFQVAKEIREHYSPKIS